MSGVRLPEKVIVTECVEHHFQNKGHASDVCLVCGLPKRDFDKFKQKRMEAEHDPEIFMDWIIRVLDQKLTCQKHRHKNTAQDR